MPEARFRQARIVDVQFGEGVTVGEPVNI